MKIFRFVAGLLVVATVSGNALANENFLNHTFTLRGKIGGDPTSFKIYIDPKGRVFFFANNQGCASTGVEGKLNGSMQSSYTCPATGGKLHVSNTMTTRLSGEHISLNMTTHARSNTAKFNTKYDFSWNSSGKDCGSVLYKVRGDGFSYVFKDFSCSVKNGR